MATKKAANPGAQASEKEAPQKPAPKRQTALVVFILFVLLIVVMAIAAREVSIQRGLASQPAAPTAVAPSGYPLADQVYASPQGDEYNAEWDQNGWLHQPSLPPGPKRKEHEVSFTLIPGNYLFNGVECSLYLDEARAGDGGKLVAERGNGLKFSVATADNGEAWGRVVCRKSEASGFSIEFRGP